MKEYRGIIKKRIIMSVSTALLAILVVILSSAGMIHPSGDTHFSGFVAGFQAGLAAVLAVFLVFFAIKYSRSLNNDLLLKKMYIAENDERTKMISEKTGGSVIYICAVIFLLSGIVSAYFSEIVFFTLLGCSLFLFTVKKVLSFYYINKY